MDIPHKWRALRESAGFTVVELMVVIAIVAILAALAAPGFKTLIDRWRVRDAQEAMISALHLVRMEAIRRGGGVVLEKRPLTGDCAYAGRSGTQYWSCGWFIYADADGNGAFDDGDVLIQSFPAPRNLNAKWSVVQRRFVFDRWGNSNIGLGSVGFTIFPEPDGDTSPVTTTLCVASGGRINAVSRSKC